MSVRRPSTLRFYRLGNANRAPENPGRPKPADFQARKPGFVCGLTVNLKSIRAEECGHAYRCTRKLPSHFLWQLAYRQRLCQRRFHNLIILIYPGKPADFQARRPGFLLAHKPGLRAWKSAGLPRFSGARGPGLNSLLPSLQLPVGLVRNDLHSSRYYKIIFIITWVSCMMIFCNFLS